MVSLENVEIITYPFHVTKLDIFEKVVKSIIFYGCEAWGFNKLPLLERLHLIFSTPKYMVYGELGRYPIAINVKVRMVFFWAKLLSQETKISSKLYNRVKNYNSPWFNYITQILIVNYLTDGTNRIF